MEWEALKNSTSEMNIWRKQVYVKSLANTILPFMKQNCFVKLFEEWNSLGCEWHKKRKFEPKEKWIFNVNKNKLISRTKSSGKTTYSEHSTVLF